MERQDIDKQILGAMWFTQGVDPHFFGVVKVKVYPGIVKYYIGTAYGNPEADIRRIADWGSKIPVEELKEFLSDDENEKPDSLVSREIRNPDYPPP